MRDRNQSTHGTISSPSNVPISIVYQPSYVPKRNIQLSPMQVHFASYPSQTIVTCHGPQQNHQQHSEKVSICNLDTLLYINVFR